jgi:hypothetical protein
MPTKDMINPPMVPAASGNQKPSFWVPMRNGVNPRMVEIMVRKMGMIFAFQAFR